MKNDIKKNLYEEKDDNTRTGITHSSKSTVANSSAEFLDEHLLSSNDDDECETNHDTDSAVININNENFHQSLEVGTNDDVSQLEENNDSTEVLGEVDVDDDDDVAPETLSAQQHFIPDHEDLSLTSVKVSDFFWGDTMKNVMDEDEEGATPEEEKTKLVASSKNIDLPVQEIILVPSENENEDILPDSFWGSSLNDVISSNYLI